jgi:4-amino-4-deoxy-L-arabinose transferase-like glycosyltransferase
MGCQENLLPSQNGLPTLLLRRTGVIIVLILLLAGLLRFVKLDQTAPPGLNQDEAANAWSAYCLLKTGKEYTGVSWPIFYVRNVGGNSSTLYVYLLMPFQAIWGLNVWTTRLPAAVGGVLTVWLIYYVGRRLFGTAIALVAAGLLAIDPWHLQHSRNGLESSVTALVSIAPLALLLWAGMLTSDNNKTPSPRPVVAAVGGLLTGIGCYGHWEVRLFMPVFLLLIVLFTLPGWWKTIKTRKGALAVGLFFAGFAATWGPLIWQHIFHSDGIGRHAQFQTGWIGSVPFFDAVKNIAVRYIQHFGPNFLFVEGDTSPVFSPPRIGQFYLYMLPLMQAGFISVVRRFKSSSSARVLAAFVLAYPVGDCLVWTSGLSILRSAPGLCALILLSAVGAVECFRWLRTRSRKSLLATTAIFAGVVIASNVWYLHYFFGEFNKTREIYHLSHTDFVEACEWLKPRFDDFDAVLCTGDELNMPYVISAVVLGYDPNRWFSEPREFTTVGEWDYYTRYGKMYFMCDRVFPSFYHFMSKPLSGGQYRSGYVLLIIRPDEVELIEPDKQILHKIIRPDGTEVLWLCVI